jgi:hypothetical protein
MRLSWFPRVEHLQQPTFAQRTPPDTDPDTACCARTLALRGRKGEREWRVAPMMEGSHRKLNVVCQACTAGAYRRRGFGFEPSWSPSWRSASPSARRRPVHSRQDGASLRSSSHPSSRNWQPRRSPDRPPEGSMIDPAPETGATAEPLGEISRIVGRAGYDTPCDPHP